MRFYDPLGIDDSLLNQDYLNASIDLLWYRERNERTLILAFVRLLPAEYPTSESGQEIDIKLKHFSLQSDLTFKRFVLSVTDALQWFADLRENHGCVPTHSDRPLKVGPVILEPDHGGWNLSNSYPFVDTKSSAYQRVRHLVASAPLEKAKEIWSDPTASAWIKGQFGIESKESPEWCGSVHIVAPNPLYRAMEHRLLPDDAGNEGMFVRFIERANKSVVGTILTVIEVRSRGVGTVHHVVSEDSQYVLRRKGIMGGVALAVSCPQRGLLEWHGELSWLRQISVRSNLFDSIVGKAHPNTLPGTLAVRQHTQRQKHLATELDQSWFLERQSEARTYIRKILSGAESSILIADPYFSDTDLEIFRNAVYRKGVQVTILTSKALLKINENEGESVENFGGKRMLELLPIYRREFEISVFVMPGARGSLHDRFIEIDGILRLSGGSLNSLGARGSMVIKVPDSAVVKKDLEAILSNSTALDVWVNEYCLGPEGRPDGLLTRLMRKIATCWKKF